MNRSEKINVKQNLWKEVVDVIHKSTSYRLWFPLLFFFFSGCSHREDPQKIQLADGLSYSVYSLPEQMSRLHVLEYQPESATLQLQTLKADGHLRGTQTVSAMLKDLSDTIEAVAAVNGDFFSQEGLPSGAQIRQGEILKDAAEGWWAFAITTGRKAFIEEIRLEAMAISGKDTLHITRFNRPRGTHETVLYNRWYGLSTGTNHYGDELVLHVPVSRFNQPLIATVVETDSGKGNHPLQDSILIISTHGTELRTRFGNLKSGQNLFLWFRTKPDSGAVAELIGGFPPLIVNGDIHPAVRGRSDFYRKRYARTAIGILNNGHILIVCAEGDQTGNRGLTLRELAEWMKSRHCRSALNLDGGGSTTLHILGKLIHPSPETGYERPISNAIALIRKKTPHAPKP